MAALHATSNTHQAGKLARKNSTQKSQKTGQPVNAPQAAVSSPSMATPEGVLGLQKTAGNRAVEREIRRQNRGRQVNEKTGQIGSGLASEIAARRGGGQPLPIETQAEMQPALGREFGDVRIHTDPAADRLSRSLHARAFTIGRDIFFRAGAYDPDSAKGQATLAHELTHVVQQDGISMGGEIRLGKPVDHLENEASRIAGSINRPASGISRRGTKRTSSPRNSHPTIQRVLTDGLLDKIGEGSESFSGVINSPVASSISGATDTKLQLLGMNPLLGTYQTEGSAQAASAQNYAVQGGRALGAWSGVKAGLDLANVGTSIWNLGASKRQQTQLEGQKRFIGAEKAWKDQKGHAKQIGSSALSLGTNVAGSVAGFQSGAAQVAQSGWSAAGTAGQASGVMGTVMGGIELARNSYGATRAFWKSHKLNQTKGQIDQYQQKKRVDYYKANNSFQKEHQAGEIEKAGKLSRFAGYARNRKAYLGSKKTIAAVGAGLGLAGGIAGLALAASNPVGWGLAAGAAAVGLGMAGYALGRGSWKRSHRRGKLSASEKELGLEGAYQAKYGKGRRAWNWMTGKDIDLRRTAVKEALDKQGEANTTIGNKTIRAAADARLERLRVNAEPALKTKKRRQAGNLVNIMLDPHSDPETKAHAQHLARTLGVVNKKGQAIQSRGWKFWQKKEDIDLRSMEMQQNDPDAVKKKAEKKSLVDLVERKI